MVVDCVGTAGEIKVDREGEREKKVKIVSVPSGGGGASVVSSGTARSARRRRNGGYYYS